MIKRKKIVISVSILLIILFFVGFIVFLQQKHAPQNELFIKGKIRGPLKEVINATFSFKTYDINQNLLRNGEIDIYLGGNITIDFEPDEKYVLIYRSASVHHHRADQFKNISFLEPDFLDIDLFKGQTLYFSYNSFYIPKVE